LTKHQKFELLVYTKQCFDTLKTYGKTPEQLETISEMFVTVLSKYPMERIKPAFLQWIERNSEMPTPADIINLIDPPPPPPWKPDWAYYVAIKESIKRGNFVSSFSDEYEYMKRCENWSIGNMKNYDEYEKAQEERLAIEKRIAITDESEDV
jgi:hypothetical protein